MLINRNSYQFRIQAVAEPQLLSSCHYHDILAMVALESGKVISVFQYVWVPTRIERIL